MKVLSGIFTLAVASAVYGASLSQITNFGSNPTNLRAYEYVPATVKSPRTLMLALHYCGGSAAGMFGSFDFDAFADRYGYIMVYPEATRSGSCWDVATSKALARNGGSDPVGIMSAVSYMISRHSIDKSRVFMVGTSSGAMMANVLLAEYPDVFNAATVFMGVPYGCFATESGGNPAGSQGAGWNGQCSGGQISKSAQEWGDSVRKAYPGYNGARPRVQLWHGSQDTTLNFKNFAEEIKMWTNVAGVSQTPTFQDSPKSSWTRARYGNNVVEAITINGVGHALPMSGQTEYMMSFMGLDGTAIPSSSPSPKVSPSPATSPRTSPATSPATSPRTSPSGNCQPIYAQCGGKYYTGSTCCSGSSCVLVNEWYSQCK